MELHSRWATTEEIANEVCGQMLEHPPARVEKMYAVNVHGPDKMKKPLLKMLKRGCK